MKKRKAGRPALPKDQVRQHYVNFRLTTPELRSLNLFVQKGESAKEAARRILLDAIGGEKP